MRNKLLFIFFGIGLLPFLLLLLYTLFFVETKIINNIVLEQSHKTEITSKQISNHLSLLSKEVKFLSSLDVMDDVLVEDIDKRISRLLEQKKADLSLDVNFSTFSNDSLVIASSKKSLLGKEQKISFANKKTSGIYSQGDKLFIYATINASFDPKKKIGLLILEYNLNNLNFYLRDKKNINSYIIHPDSKFIIGDNRSIIPEFDSNNGNIINDNYLIVYQKLSGVLHEFYLVYSTDKAIALEFLYNFTRFMLYISIFIVILIIFLSLKYSNAVVKPIQKTISASDAKSAFISNMSHELRTPLNSIIGFSQNLITYEDLKDEQLDTIGSIESSAQYLLSMINDILDIAKIESGKMQVDLEKINILELVQECYNMMSPLVYDKNLTFKLIYTDLSTIQCITDPKICKQIILNLISNAIKFTQEGSITIRLYSEENMLFVSIEDTGIGILPEDIQLLFNDFTQLENIMHKQHKGTGLGLALSKKMANILDGDIKIQSDGLKKGTKSIFFIPQATKEL